MRFAPEEDDADVEGRNASRSYVAAPTASRVARRAALSALEALDEKDHL
jgi:hypothetical protein